MTRPDKTTNKKPTNKEKTMTFRTALRSAIFGLAAMGLAVPATADQLDDIKAAGKIVTATDWIAADWEAAR